MNDRPDGNTYQTILHVNPVDEETEYRLVATREHCDLFESVLAVRCADNLSYSPAIIVPAGLGSVAVVLGIIKRSSGGRRKVTIA